MDLDIHTCDISTVKPIVESRVFKKIEIRHTAFKILADVNINTEILCAHCAALEDILKIHSITAISLTVVSPNINFNDDLLNMNIK